MAASTIAPPRAALTQSAGSPGARFGPVVASVLVLDGVIVCASIVAAVWLRFGLDPWPPAGSTAFTGIPAVDFGWILPVWLCCLAVQDVYSQRRFARGSDEFKALLKASVNAALVVSVVAYLINYDISRGFYLYVFAVGTPLLLLERFAVSRAVGRARQSGRLMHRAVVVGSVVEIAQFSALISKRVDLGYQIVGACVSDQTSPTACVVPVVGSVRDAVPACARLGADTLVVVGGSQVVSVDLRAMGWDLEGSDIDLIVVPSLLDVAGPRIRTRPVAGLPFLHIEPPHTARAMKWNKALFDRATALGLLLLLAPWMIAIAAAVKLDSPGPVFFRQRRVGAHGRQFHVWKFRSMVADAESLHEALIASEGGRVLLFKARNDPRVTRVGRLIRRYSLDELPQLVNVLRGDMSLVGPRPHLAAEVEEYDGSDHRRLLVRPGMTGLWQVSGRSDLAWDEAVRLDLYYIDNWSMAGDIVILIKTLRAVLRAQGAY